MKVGAFSGLAVEIDISSHQPAQMLADRQTQAGPSVLACGRIVDLHKRAEQLLPLVGGNADTRVLNPPVNPVPALLCR